MHHVIEISGIHTSDAIPVLVDLRVLDPNQAITFQYCAIAKTSANIVLAWHGSRTWQRIGSAAPTAVGLANLPLIDPNIAIGDPSITVVASGADKVALRLVGLLLTEIDWAFTIDATLV